MSFQAYLKFYFVVDLDDMWGSSYDGRADNKNVYPRCCDVLVFYALSIDYGQLTFILLVYGTGQSE